MPRSKDVPTVTMKDIRNLTAAVEEAATWAGSMDLDDREVYNEWIEECRQSVQRVRNDRRQLSRMLKS